MSDSVCPHRRQPTRPPRPWDFPGKSTEHLINARFKRYLKVPRLVKNPPAIWETWVQSLNWEDPLEKGKITHSSIMAWRIPWTIYSPWGHKESDMTERLSLSSFQSSRRVHSLEQRFLAKYT